MLMATNKRLLIFESRGDSNRCTRCRENLIHMTRKLSAPVHICYTYTSCGQSPYVTIFHVVPPRLKRDPTPGRSLGTQRSPGLTVVLGDLILPPMRQPWSRGKKFRPSSYTTALVYWAHITSM
jgi:hypothetical protein